MIPERVTALPDSRPDRRPAGFTCTGLSRIASGALAGHWLVADDGRLVEGDSSPFAPAVHVLTPDFGAILRSISVGDSTHSAQGVAFDTLRGGFWVALSASGWVRYFTLEGVEDTGLSFQLNLIAGLTTWVPNGLAYIPSLDQLFCASSIGKVVRRFYADPASIPAGGNRHVACSAFNLSVAGADSNSSPDHFHTGDDGSLYFTLGTNGRDGRVGRVADPLAPEASGTDVLLWTLPGADAGARRVTIANDRGYHAGGARDPQNTIREYRLPESETSAA